MGTSCAQLLPFYDDYFETVRVLMTWSWDVHLLFIQDVNLDIFSLQCYQCLYVQGCILSEQLLLQFYIVLFETLHVLIPRPEDMNVHRIKLSD